MGDRIKELVCIKDNSQWVGVTEQTSMIRDGDCSDETGSLEGQEAINRS